MTGKRKIVTISCAAAGVCLAGIVTAAILVARGNPLAKGLMELSEELTALEAEMGEYFWTDAIDQIGSKTAQAEYSLNIGGIPELENITVGIDGKTRRDMEEKLFDTEVDISIGNVNIAKAQLSGTEDTIDLRIPSVWEGSIVLNTSDIDGQWNDSAMKKSLQLLTREKLEIERQIDVDFFTAFTVEPFSIADFRERNGDVLRDFCKNMEVTAIGKAEKEGTLSKAQAESLQNVSLQNESGETIETTGYLTVLPKEELCRIFPKAQGDIRLCVYLDSQKRIVRICTLPGENPAGDVKVVSFAVNLTGTKSVTDRIELEAVVRMEERAAEETIILEKEPDKAGAYRAAWSGSLSEGGNRWDFSLECSILGERVSKEGQSGAAERLSIELDHFVMKSEGKVICRGSGSAVFAPLDEEIQISEGAEHRIAEMSELETTLFLAECTKNVYENYSGYLRLLR